VNPYRLGGARLADLVVKPAIVNFFDASVDGSDLQLDQTSLGPSSRVVGQTLAKANMRQRWGLGVVAVQRGREVVASPLADFTLQAGDVLVVFGSREQIAAFDSECG
jgi:voltage-gated potassium channel